MLSETNNISTTKTMTGQDVYPDDALLQQIFGTEVSAKRAEIILQTWDKCIFKIDTTASGDDGDSESVVVRLESASETMKSRFVLCSVLQKMASKYLPDLVPSVLQTGLARGLDGREYCFSVVVFVDGVTLDNVWGQLEPSNQKSIVNDISNAAKELRSMKVRDEAVQTALRCAAGVLEDEATKEKLLYFGGPHTSVLSKGSSLFDAFMERRSLKTTFYTAIREQGRITIESKFPDLGSVTLAQDCMDRWPDEAVFCHNDLTPRNIILNKIQNTTRNKRHAYKLAAIIDWELAGFYPASYELLLQDTYLGINSQYPDFHMMLNEKNESGSASGSFSNQSLSGDGTDFRVSASPSV